MNQHNIRSATFRLVTVAVIGAIYVALTMLVAPIGYGAWQFRISEALTILPFVMPGSMFGLGIGCALANFMSSYGIPDIVFGSLATLLAGYLTSKIKNKWLAPLPPVLINAVVVGALIAHYDAGGFTAAFGGLWAFNMLTVGLGQVAACYVVGMPLLTLIQRAPALKRIFSDRA